ncbi:enoyl-CoA hydratase/isomerase family protein [Ornithinimicrobium sp. Arc0846-15]|nr:enoyl-CoA hydratase/isomerase family protein [Ornithinimicrobium laminariae]
MTENVLLTRQGHVAVLSFNRPDAMNALDIATKETLLAHLREVAADSEVRAVVLTGSGRAFCVGQDLREHITLLRDDPAMVARTVRDHYNPIAELIATMDKPVIAAVNGVAAGAGASIAFGADLRLVADTASFNLAFAGVALSCDTGASFLLPQLVGMAKAKELLLQPSTIDAQTALDLGLATRVLPAAELEEAALALAQQLAQGPTLAYGSMRQALAFASGASISDALEFEATMMNRTGSSADHKIAVQAFLAKEKPNFTGQ